MESFARRTATVLFTVLAFVVALAIVYIARSVIVLFAFAILFAYLINPVVRLLQRHSLLFRNLKGPHVAEAYLACLILIVVILHGFAVRSSRRPSEVLGAIPAAIERVSSGEIAFDLGKNFGWSDDKSGRVRAAIQKHGPGISSFFANVERRGFQVAGAFIVIPILAIFFLSDGENLANEVIGLVSTKETHENIRVLAVELDFTLQRYIRAKVILATLSFCYCTLTMLLLGFPEPFLLGMIAGVLEFIPMAGWMLSFVTISTVGFLSHSHWIWMMGVLAVWRLCMDYGISPRVMGHELELHPVVALFTMMTGGAIGGIVGIYLSIPLVAALRVVWRRIIAHPHVAATAAPSSESQS
jgi:predicted PurR-regulated permease PerM